MTPPRFTVRTGLLALTATAFLSLVVRQAWFAEPWAVGTLIALGSLVALFGIHAAFFFAAVALSRGAEERGSPGRRA